MTLMGFLMGATCCVPAPSPGPGPGPALAPVFAPAGRPCLAVPAFPGHAEPHFDVARASASARCPLGAGLGAGPRGRAAAAQGRARPLIPEPAQTCLLVSAAWPAEQEG